jgi:hypothetical protein
LDDAQPSSRTARSDAQPSSVALAPDPEAQIDVHAAMTPDPEASAAAEQVLSTVLQARSQIQEALYAVGETAKADSLKAQIACLDSYASELEKFIQTGGGLDNPQLPAALQRDTPRADSGFKQPELAYLVDDMDKMPFPSGGVVLESPTGSTVTDRMVVATPAALEPEVDDQTSGQEIDHVRRVRRQILAHNAGRDISEAAETPHYVDEDCDADIEELRRVRRQIRYLFGSAPLTVPAFVPAAQPAPTFAPADLSALKLPPNSARQHDDGPVAPAAPHVPDLPLTRETTAPPRLENANAAAATPRSAKSIHSNSRSSYSVSATSDRDGRRRRHRDKDRRRRDERSERKEEDWAQEVIKASLDPKNQWDFGDSWGSKSRQPRQGSQQNQRFGPGANDPRNIPFDVSDPGAEVFRKAQQRAEEVLRAERARGY